MPVENIITAHPVELKRPASSAQGTISGMFNNMFGSLRRIFQGGPLAGEYGVQSSMPVLSPFQANPVGEPNPKTRPAQTTAALGGTGVPIYAGFVTDLGEYNGKLQGRDAFDIYEKMRRSDPDCRAGLQASKLPIRCAQYQVVPGVTAASPLHALATEIADFVTENLFGGLESMSSTGFYHSQTFESVLENALLELDFGCACHEILWHVDGSKVRMRRLAPRLPATFFRFYPDTDGETLLAMEQYGYRGDCIDVTTPVPSPDGWTTMSEVAVGDRVFDESGLPCKVTAKSPVYTDKPCYKITFSDGTSLIATDGHKWTVLNESTRQCYAHRTKATEYSADWWKWSGEKVSGRLYTPTQRDLIVKRHTEGATATEIAKELGRSPSAITQFLKLRPTIKRHRSSAITLKTEELIGKLRKGRSYDFAIPFTQPIPYAEKQLPLDPYVLGYLLGDGTSSGNGDVACDYPDKRFLMEEFARLGYKCNDREDPGAFYVSKLAGLWFSMGLLGNKHIPEIYFTSSMEQRVALLQGLMDSDGNIGTAGEYAFSNTNPRLAHGAAKLARSLGLAAKVRPRPSRRHPKTGNMTLPSFIVAINSTFPLARLRRKVSKARHTWNLEQHGRMIVSIEPIEPVKTQCITVDSPSHLYLVGEAFIPTHNSYINVILPSEKIDYFTYDKEGADFYGRSSLRYAYAPWYIKSNLYRLDSIAIERNGMGIPVMQMAENADDDDKAYAQRFVTQVATHEQTGLTIPFGYDFKLVGMTGRIRDPKTSIQHHSEQILRSFLAQFLAFGTTATGSRSLSQDMTTFFKLGLNTVARGITSTISNSSIRRLVDFNYGDSRKQIPYPRLVHSNIAALDPMELAEKIKNLAQWQVDLLQPDDELENWFRTEYGLPAKTKMRVRWMPVQTRLMEQPAADLTPAEIEAGKDPGGPQPVVEGTNPTKGISPPRPPTPSKGNYTPGVEPNPHRTEPAKEGPIATDPTAKIKASETVEALLLLADATPKGKFGKRINWDFDGTISVFPGAPQVTFKKGEFGECSENARALMTKLAAAGFTNAIVTARKDIQDVAAKVKEWKLPVESVGNEKLPCLASIDDRGIHIEWNSEYDPVAVQAVLKALKKIAKQHADGAEVP